MVNLLNLTLYYVITGALFAIVFLWRGLDKIDPDAAGSSIYFRLIILPGVVIFWPKLLLNWLKKNKI